ncbi:hypothetical protein D046_3339A, partial [Vibrio parahaemolyticus V-223/04]
MLRLRIQLSNLEKN